MSNTNYKMPNFDKYHRAISTRITTLSYLLACKNGHDQNWLMEQSGIEPIEFKRMEFCYDPKNQESLKQMISWLKQNEPVIQDFNKNLSQERYDNDYPPLSIFDDLFN